MTTRKPIYNPADFTEEICEWLAAGKTLASYCRQPNKPSVRLVYEWRASDVEFAARFARAREAGFDVMADDLEQIAEEPSEHPDDVAHRKLRVWTRLQLLARWSPRYSERSTVQVGGDPAGVPIQIDDAERVRRIESLLATAAARKASQQGADDAGTT
jgi:hypothetical protein